MNTKTAGHDPIRLIVKRQEGPNAKPHWEEFSVAHQPHMNVVSALMEIWKNPVNAQGKPTTPVVWESVCLEEVCGACTMIINGTPCQACSALIDDLRQPIRLEPLTKFPLVRDLKVDRTLLFDALKKTHAWIDIDGPFDLGPGPRMSARTQSWAYELSRCMTCGCCFEACPNTGHANQFLGPAAISQVRLFNAHPTGKLNKQERLRSIMGADGITSCGNAQNCVRVCPKDIPLTTSIAQMNRDTTVQSIRNVFGSDA